MPTKHVSDETWRLIEKETVKAVKELEKGVSETKVMDFLIKKGIENTNPEDYSELLKPKKK